MNLIVRDRDRQIEILSKDNAMLKKDNAILSKDNVEKDKRIAEKDKRIAELERKLGLNGVSTKPAPRSKVRSRNSAKARATANT